jgi:hypothetical protein
MKIETIIILWIVAIAFISRQNIWQSPKERIVAN